MINDVRINKLIASNYKCEVCGKIINEYNSQLAHIIPQTIPNIKKYGRSIIHHTENMKIVCSLACNSTVNIGCKPETERQLVIKINNMIIWGNREQV